MAVFRGDQSQKSDYRKFKIKTVEGANDAAMIKEILKRRLKHIEWPYLDLMIIDGGLAQLKAGLSQIANRKITERQAPSDKRLAIIALAKQEDKIYTQYSQRAIYLKELPISLRLTFQAIRDEAHRFAIFYYRHLHAKQYESPKNPRKIGKKTPNPGA